MFNLYFLRAVNDFTKEEAYNIKRNVHEEMKAINKPTDVLTIISAWESFIKG